MLIKSATFVLETKSKNFVLHSLCLCLTFNSSSVFAQRAVICCGALDKVLGCLFSPNIVDFNCFFVGLRFYSRMYFGFCKGQWNQISLFSLLFWFSHQCKEKDILNFLFFFNTITTIVTSTFIITTRLAFEFFSLLCIFFSKMLRFVFMPVLSKCLIDLDCLQGFGFFNYFSQR